MNERILTAEQFDAYSCWLRQSERSPATIEKYLRDVRAFAHWLNGKPVTKEMVTGFIRLNGMTVGVVGNRTEKYDEDGNVAEKYADVLTARRCR